MIYANMVGISMNDFTGTVQRSGKPRAMRDVHRRKLRDVMDWLECQKVHGAIGRAEAVARDDSPTDRPIYRAAVVSCVGSLRRRCSIYWAELSEA